MTATRTTATASPTARERLAGLAATLVIIAIAVGIPLVLVALWRTLWPDGLDWELLRIVLTSPDDGALLLHVLLAVGWGVWAPLTAMLLAEIISAVRQVPTPRLPALPQGVVGKLVATASLLATSLGTQPTLTAASASATVSEAPVDPGPTPGTTAAGLGHPGGETLMSSANRGPDRPTTVSYTIQHLDTLWRLAERHLGDGSRYTEILELNHDVLGDNEDFLPTGETIQLPTPQDSTRDDAKPESRPEPEAQTETYIVRPGDTLWQIAAQKLDAPERYPDIARASRDTIQPDGDRLTDPNHIEPGWTLQVPVTAAAEPVADTASGEDSKPNAAAGPTSESTPEPGRGDTTAPAERDQGLTHSFDRSGTPRAVAPGADGRPSSPGTAEQDRAPDADQAGDEEATSDHPPWLLPGLTGAGVILGAAVLSAVRRGRATQWRYRRPGRSIAPVPAEAVPVERTLRATAADDVIPAIEHLDLLLRSLAGSRSTDGPGAPRPPLFAVELTADEAVLHLATSAEVPAPWTGSGTRWVAPLSAADPRYAREAAPYPLLVTIGVDDDGHTWLLDLERARAVTVTGDAEHVQAFGRHTAAETMLHQWAASSATHTVGTSWRADRLSGDRGHHHDQPDPGCLEDIADTIRSGRQFAEDSRELIHFIIADKEHRDEVRGVEGALHEDTTARAGGAVLALGSTPHELDLVIDVDGGRLRIPALGLDLSAVGLTETELSACEAIVSAAQFTDDVPTPALDGDGWRAMVDVTGALLPEISEPRPDDPDEPAGDSSALPDAASAYEEAAATTVVDVATLAPRTPSDTAARLAAEDSNLDDDVAAWFDADARIPRLKLLGPVTLDAYGPRPATSKPLHIEVLAYIALHPHGVTPAQTATDLRTGTDPLRTYVSHLRKWLGVNPRTRRPYLPAADKTDAARATGTAAYQIEGLLTDVDLFRRLHARGLARDAEGQDDFVTALRLVRGEPFSHLRPKGWNWLAEGIRHDHAMTAGIVDLAHLVVTRALKEGDQHLARFAADVARTAAPDDEISLLDDITIQAIDGHMELARRRTIEEIHGRIDDEFAPTEPPERTQEIIERSGLNGERQREPRAGGK